MNTIHPFADQGSFTSVHNAVFDVMMPDLPPNAFKVLCLVIRKTRGWIDKETGQRKESDQLSYSQIMSGTGIKAPATLATALKVLTDRKYILCSAGETRWEAMTYRLNTALEIEVASTTKIEAGKSTSKNVEATKIEAAPTSKNVVAPTSKIEDTKERGKKEERNTPPSPQTIPHGGGGGGDASSQKKKNGGPPPHVQFLAEQGMGAAHLFTDCDPEATIADYQARIADGWTKASIVTFWKHTPPRPDRIYKPEEHTHAANQSQRPAPAQRPRPPRPGERGYTGRS